MGHGSTEPGGPVAGLAAVRVRFDIGYDGTGFSGWARQPGRRTVQETLEDALARVLGLPEPAPLTVAGRTDAGVHARGQVAHADIPAGRWAAAGPAAVRRLARLLPPRRGSTPGSPRSGGGMPTGCVMTRRWRIRWPGTARCGTGAGSTSRS